MKNDKYYYKVKDNVVLAKGVDKIIYRVWWMVLVNLILKIIQPFTKKPFLISVISTIDDQGNPHFDRYCWFESSFCNNDFIRIHGVRFLWL
jgi:hypothetical protein